MPTMDPAVELHAFYIPAAVRDKYVINFIEVAHQSHFYLTTCLWKQTEVGKRS